MVSFWPWKGDDSSPASFEKALSTLSAKISKTSQKLDSLRQRARRFSVLWTLYAGFAYLLYTIILVLVIGWEKWGLLEYAAVVGGPVIIYMVRFGLLTYFDYRTSSIQAQMNDLQKQRDVTINKLKTATKYDSTQELLKKYGGTPTPKPKPTGTSDHKISPKSGSAPKASRAPFIPPPTANIPGRNELARRDSSSSGFQSPAGRQPGQQSPLASADTRKFPQSPVSPNDTFAEFAPNAFPEPPQYANFTEGSRWYDRLLDVLLGEDETRPGARLALICSRCRLVNGQAPPGVKRLEDLGKWRCGGCGAMNGEESDVKKIVSSIQKESQERAIGEKDGRQNDSSKGHDKDRRNSFTPSSEDHDDDSIQYSPESSEEADDGKEMIETKNERISPATQPDTSKRRSTRSTKGKKAG